MSLPTHRPALASRNLSIGYGVLLAVICALGTRWTLLTAFAGFAFIGLGLVISARLLVSIGLAWFALAAVIFELGDGPIELILLVVLLAVLSWDSGQRAIDVGDQLGREASTGRVELFRAGSSVLVGVTATGIGYSIYSITDASQPFAAVALLLVLATGITVWMTR